MTKILFGLLKSIKDTLYVFNVVKVKTEDEVLYTILSFKYYIIINRRRRHRFLRKYKKRRWWVRPINVMRDPQGDFAHLFQELKYDADIFFKYTRMNENIFNLLLCKVRPYLQKNNWRALLPEQRLIMTVR